jgi:CRP/FNR family transcriptional regulator
MTEKELLSTEKCSECKTFQKCFSDLLQTSDEFLNIKKSHIHYKKGETISKQGVFAYDIAIIKEGFVKLLHEGAGNKNLIFSILKPGDFLGLSTLSGNRKCYYTATAISDCEVCLIEKNDLYELLKVNDKIIQSILEWHCRYEEMIFTKLVCFKDKHLHGRLADVILFLNEEEFQCNEFISNFTRKDIANMIGTSSENTTRLLTEFKTDGLIQFSGKQIVIKDMKRLEQISQKG